MAVQFTEIKKRGGNITEEGDTWIDTYVIKGDAGTTQDDVKAALRAKGVFVNSWESNRKCTSIRLEMVSADGQLWNAIASYSSVPWATGTYAPGDEGTPLDEPWGISFSSTAIQQVVDRAYWAGWENDSSGGDSSGGDSSGGDSSSAVSDTPDKPIVNAVNDCFDPPLMQDLLLPVIELTKNMSISDFTNMLNSNVEDSVNASEITIAGMTIKKHCGKISIQGSRGYYYTDNGSVRFYMRAQVVIVVNPRTWKRFVLNQGMRHKVEGKDEPVRAIESGYKDKAADTPVLLDKDGYLLGAKKDSSGEGGGEAEEGGSGSAEPEPVYCVFLTYPEKDWPDNLPSDLGDN